jgi:NADH-quinone oxidoreductase subunit E
MLSQASLQKIDKEIAKYPINQKQSAVMSSLAIAQKEVGHISTEIIAFIAEYLGMPAIAVQEVSTFYNMYDNEKIGKYKLTICTNLPCALSGGDIAADYLKEKLGIDFNQTTPCGKFTLKEGECMGACGDAPVLLVNNQRMCSFMQREKLDALIEDLKKDN